MGDVSGAPSSETTAAPATEVTSEAPAETSTPINLPIPGAALCHRYFHTIYKYRIYRARALGLLLADGAPTVGWGHKRCFLAGNQFFVNSLKNNCYHHDGTPKRQRFCVAHVAEIYISILRWHYIFIFRIYTV